MLILGNKELEEQRLLGNKDPEEKRLLCCRVVPGSVVHLQQVGSAILVQHEVEARHGIGGQVHICWMAAWPVHVQQGYPGSGIPRAAICKAADGTEFQGGSWTPKIGPFRLTFAFTLLQDCV